MAASTDDVCYVDNGVWSLSSKLIFVGCRARESPARRVCLSTRCLFLDRRLNVSYLILDHRVTGGTKDLITSKEQNEFTI